MYKFDINIEPRALIHFQKVFMDIAEPFFFRQTGCSRFRGEWDVHVQQSIDRTKWIHIHFQLKKKNGKYDREFFKRSNWNPFDVMEEMKARN